MITIDNFKKVLEALGFYLETGTDFLYQNTYSESTDSSFALSVDLKNEQFLYPDEIHFDRGTTLDFHQQESFVVFECIARLFAVGYRPENLWLEGKNYQGQDLGWIDILVKDNNEIEYLIIECKTSDSTAKEDEFSKHWKKTLSNGDQLFRYFNTYSKAQYLCLYTADFVDDKLTDTYHLITLKDNEEYLRSDKRLKSYKSLRENQGSAEEFFEVWKNTYGQDFSTNGMIEKDSKPFDIGQKKYSVDDLKEIDSSSMQKKYNEFATILRKYNVSSKENAFDKLINLFLAKIVDETYYQSELRCLWRGAAYDNYYDLQDRLQGLYKKGMEDFFKDTVAYVENNEIEAAFSFLKSKADEAKSTILSYFRTLKYYNNNPFAFLDVHNEDLFNKNSVILKDIVNMIQDIKIKTENQNQFLGDLFEGFLDQGIKQSEGQFFTPMPIVKFLISSLPLENLIGKSAEIPKVIDYACGAGHFLTEYANQIKPFVEKYKKAELAKYYEHIHGIEKEYRLSKVSQVSAFMYGQDGIHIFYKDALSRTSDIQENTYSVLIANPPYSVKGFLQTLDDADREQYELFNDDINLDSNNSIETFFVERAKLLLKPSGIAAIILPSSVLSNGNIYTHCREIIFKYFDVLAIFESGSGTFGKTGTNTATLFLRKKAEMPSISEHYKNRVEAWFGGNFDDDKYYEDFDFVERYCAHIGVNVEDYKTLLKKEPSEILLQNDLFATYIETLDVYSQKVKSSTNTKGMNEGAKKIRTDIRNRVAKPAFKKLTKAEQDETVKKSTVEFICEIEKEKLYYFMLLSANPQSVVCVKSPEKKAIKEFLGYEWSDTKGNEGIKYINVQVKKSDDDGEESDDTIAQIKGIDGIRTPLFNPKDFDDASKINTLIRANFEGKTVSVPAELSEYVKTVRLVDMVDFSRASFDKAIKTNVQTATVQIESKYELVKLGDIAEIQKGKSITSTNVIEGSVKVVAGGIDYAYLHNEANRPANIITVSASGANAGFVNYWNEPIFASDCTTILAKDELTTKYVFNVLKTYQELVFHLQKGSAQPHVYADDLKALQIPKAPLDVQNSIVTECEQIDGECQDAQKQIEKAKSEIAEIMETVHNSDAPVMELSSLIMDTEYGTAKKSEKQGKVPVIRMGNIQDGHIDMTDLVYSNDESDIEKLALKKYDVLFNRTNSPEHVGKVGIYLSDKPAIFAGYLIRIHYKPELIEPVYLCHILNSKKIREYGFSIMSKSINQANISGSALQKYKIPVPPLAEQQKIVAQISALEAKITIAKQTMNECPAKKQTVLNKWLR
ncbi:MAG: restriction endonuclease subunit S [Spirochaetaceae bacterium]|nr:restriction endonuclease subunit S [Spirochaetaceae bacterium]